MRSWSLSSPILLRVSLFFHGLFSFSYAQELSTQEIVTSIKFEFQTPHLPQFSAAYIALIREKGSPYTLLYAYSHKNILAEILTICRYELLFARDALFEFAILR